MIFIFFQDDIIDMVAEFFNKIGGYLTLSITILGFLIGFTIKLIGMRKDVTRKLVRAMGAGKLMDILLKIDKMSDKVPLSALDSCIDRFSVELGMKDIAVDLSAILAAKKALKEPSVSEVLQEYKKKQDYGIIKNKKQWNELRRDPKVDKALGVLVEHLVKKYTEQIQKAREKGNVDQIKQVIDAIKNDENIKLNRQKRKEIETFNEELRNKEKEVDLKRISQQLHDIFKGEK